MKKKVIGISAAFDSFKKGLFFGSNRIYVVSNYVEAVLRAGAVPLVFPSCQLETDDAYVEELMELVDGIILTGGNDVDPSSYNEEPHPLLGELMHEKDRLEFKMMDLAFKANKGIFGICKGMQLMNIYFGGSLYQDLSQYEDLKIKHSTLNTLDRPNHSIEVEEGSLFYEILGKEHRVNSAHHQAIARLGEGLKVAAKSPDGIIEAVYHGERKAVFATQFHPEMTALSDAKSQALFDYFVSQL